MGKHGLALLPVGVEDLTCETISGGRKAARLLRGVCVFALTHSSGEERPVRILGESLDYGAATGSSKLQTEWRKYALRQVFLIAGDDDKERDLREWEHGPRNSPVSSPDRRNPVGYHAQRPIPPARQSRPEVQQQAANPPETWAQLEREGQEAAAARKRGHDPSFTREERTRFMSLLTRAQEQQGLELPGGYEALCAFFAAKRSRVQPSRPSAWPQEWRDRAATAFAPGTKDRDEFEAWYPGWRKRADFDKHLQKQTSLGLSEVTAWLMSRTEGWCGDPFASHWEDGHRQDLAEGLELGGELRSLFDAWEKAR
jgi:hypothetical protein